MILTNSTNSTVTVDLNQSRAGQVAAAVILCPAIAAIGVTLRIYTRFMVLKKRFLEDYLIGLAIVIAYTPGDNKGPSERLHKYSSFRRRCPCAMVSVSSSPVPRIRGASTVH